MHLSWLRFGHGLVLSSMLLWIGVAVMLFAWLWLGRRVLAGDATEYTMIAHDGLLAGAAAAAGAGLQPRHLLVPGPGRAAARRVRSRTPLGPIENPNVLLDNVSPIWTITTAPYGPAFILVAKFVTMLVGDNVIAGTMLLRLCMLPGLALLIWAAPRIARHVGGRRRHLRCGSACSTRW